MKTKRVRRRAQVAHNSNVLFSSRNFRKSGLGEPTNSLVGGGCWGERSPIFGRRQLWERRALPEVQFLRPKHLCKRQTFLWWPTWVVLGAMHFPPHFFKGKTMYYSYGGLCVSLLGANECLSCEHWKGLHKQVARRLYHVSCMLKGIEIMYALLLVALALGHLAKGHWHYWLVHEVDAHLEM